MRSPVNSPEILPALEHLNELLTKINEANHEKLGMAFRYTIKRITLRRGRRNESYHQIVLWDGVIKFRDALGIAGVIPLTDDGILTAGHWREATHFIRQRGDVVFFREVCGHLRLKGSSVSLSLAQAVLSGKLRNFGHQKRLDRRLNPDETGCSLFTAS